MRATTLMLLVATAAAFVLGKEWLYVALGLLLLVLLLAEASAPRYPGEPAAPEPQEPEISAAEIQARRAYSAGQSFTLGLMRGEISHAVGKASSEEMTAKTTDAISGASRRLTKKIDKLEKKIDKLEEGRKKHGRYRYLDDD